MSVITFAHRGARLDEAENTIPAFRRALEVGASGVETDVWLSTDGEVVCAHDPVVSRGLRRRKIASTNADELAEYGIPRMADVYRELGTAFECSVDVKSPDAAAGLVEVARSFGAQERLWVCSPDLALLRTLRAESRRDDASVKLVHSERRNSISAPLERHAFDLASAGLDAMNMHHSEWTAGLVSLFHRFDIKAFAWDAQEVRHLRAVLAMGIDAVYCDRPERMVATVSEWIAD
ncbi:MAG: glycerophosphoryl diester phosphodiesterase [Actinomycetota bacterium]|nr:glycerophosphoryl diester phosphodiesterase [Actinomycetota bacterium]